jgi:hypothetical protein
MHAIPEDIEAIIMPPFSHHDGVLGIYQDDDRAVSLWSHYHAERVVLMLRELREREAAFQWALADVTPRGNAALIAHAEANLAAVRADKAEWEAKRDLLETARQTDSYAPRTYSWE